MGGVDVSGVRIGIAAALDGAALRSVFTSSVFHSRYWQNLGNNVSTKHSTRVARVSVGLRLLQTYLNWIEGKGAVLFDIQTDARLIDMNSFAYGYAVADALHRCALSTPSDQGSTVIFFQLVDDKSSTIKAFLDERGLSQSSAQTAMAFVRAVMRWLTTCVTQFQALGGRVAHGLVAYLSGFEESAAAPLKQLSAYKRKAARRVGAANVELWSNASEPYLSALYATYGDLLFWLRSDLDELTMKKDDLHGRQLLDDDARRQIAHDCWDLVAVLASGVGTFSLVRVWVVEENVYLTVVVQRRGVALHKDDHVFRIGLGELVFNVVDRGKLVSGFFRDGSGEVYVKVAVNAGQKDWLLESPMRVPPFARDFVNDTISNDLLGDAQCFDAPSDLNMDRALAAFQLRHSLPVPLMLQTKGDALSFVSVKRRRRVMQQQLKDIRAAHELKVELEITTGKDDEDGGDGVVDDEPGAAAAFAGVVEQPIVIKSLKLAQVIVRRLLTTLMHDLYMRRLVDADELCSATYLNLHGLLEARKSYSCIEQIFVDYDDHRFSHWRRATTAWSTFIATSIKKDGRVALLDGASCIKLNGSAIDVHETVRRHAQFHSKLFRSICPICCIVDLSNRQYADIHTCFSNNKLLIKQSMVDDEEG